MIYELNPSKRGINHYASKHKKEMISKTIIYIILILLGFLYIFPFLWMVSTSIKPDEELFSWPPNLIPSRINFKNYPDALNFIPFGNYIKNTLVYCILTVIGVTCSCTFAAYGFSRIKWPERDKLFMLVLATMMLKN